MYTPPAFAETRPEILHEFIRAHPLGILVTSSARGLFGTHLPFLLDDAAEGPGVLHGHIARANPHHRLIENGAEALAIFTGPEAYVTPTWYPSKREHGRVVPTWDYVAVHVYGSLRVVDDADFLRRHVTMLTHVHEGTREQPWAVSDAPAEYIERLLASIVGLELRITRLEGKWKASQNRSREDIAGVVAGLSSTGNPADAAMAAVVRARSRANT